VYADKHELSVYDACYAVLAEAQGGVLVTADRRLAATSSAAELLT
jgi:predicted nucleic acid-binding protein